MNPALYEQLCRRYVSENYNVPLAQIESRTIPNARRPGLPEFGHQIDLRWVRADEFSGVVYIAEVKWRGSAKIDKPKISALAKTCQDVGAHKAVLITSVGFTSGAEAAAKHEGISLHVVHPNFDYGAIPKGTPEELQSALSDAARPGEELYTYQVVHRAAQPTSRSAPEGPKVRPAPKIVTREARGYPTRQATNLTTRSGPGPGATHRSLGGSPASSPARTSGGGPITRGGGGLTRGGGAFERR